MTEEVKAVCIVLGILAVFGTFFWWQLYRVVKANKADAGTDALEEMWGRLEQQSQSPAPLMTEGHSKGGLNERPTHPRPAPPKPQTSKSAPRRKPSKKPKPRKKA